MTSRRPPSQRDPEYTVARMNRALQSMAPGTMGGRVANASPVIGASDAIIPIMIGGDVSTFDDSGVVHLAGAELITGYKTFTDNLLLQSAGNAVLTISADTDNTATTETPTLRLQRGAGTVSTRLGIETDSSTSFYTEQANALRLGTNSTARVTISAAGNVVIEGTGSLTVPGTVSSGTGSSVFTLATVDQVNGAWLRFDGTSLVLSSKGAGDVYFGYQGRTGLAYHFGDGSNQDSIAVLTTTSVTLKSATTSTGTITAKSGATYDNTAALRVTSAAHGIGANAATGQLLLVNTSSANTGANLGRGVSVSDGTTILGRVHHTGVKVTGTDIAFDTIMGAAGAGAGQLGAQAVFGYNIKDGAITYDKLSLGAIATIQTSPAQTRSGFTRYVTSPATTSDADGNSIGNILTNGIAVADGLAYGGRAVQGLAGTTANNTTIMYGPYYGQNTDTTKSTLKSPNQGPGLAPGQYRAKVFVRVASTASTSPVIGIDVFDARGTSIIAENGVATDFTPAQIASTNYVAISVPFTVVADTYSTSSANGVQVRAQYRSAAATTIWISHVVVEPYDGPMPNEITTTFIRDASINSAKISEVSAARLSAGVINVDDIYLGPSGRIYAGPTGASQKTGQRVELNSAGLYAYAGTTTTVTATTVQLLGTGSFTLRSADSSSRIEFTNTGLALYSGTTQTVNLANTGAFTLQSAATGSRVKIDTTTGVQVFNGAEVTPRVKLGVDGTFSIDSAPDAAGATTRIELDSAGLRFYNGVSATPTVELKTADGSARFAGTLDAASGVFTGALSGGTIQIGGTSGFLADGTSGIWLGASTFAAAPFSVSLAGALKSTSGTIGGFTIGATTITGGTLSLSNAGTITGGTISGTNFRTAASGKRVEMLTANANRLDAYSGHASELAPGGLISGIHADLYAGGLTNVATLQVSSPNLRSSGVPSTIFDDFASIQLHSKSVAGETPSEIDLTAGLILLAGATTIRSQFTVDVALGGSFKWGGASARGTNYIRRTQSATFTTANNTWTDTYFNTTNAAVQDNGDVAATPNMISQIPGIYVFQGILAFDASSTGSRGVRFVTQGGTVIGYSVVSASVQDTPSTSGVVHLPGGGYTIKLQRFQNSGATLGSPATPAHLSFVQVA